MLNLTEEAVVVKEVEIKKIYTLFKPVEKKYRKNFQSLAEVASIHRAIDAIYIAILINVDQYTEPPYVIGLETVDFDSIDQKPLKKALYKHFHDFVPFIFVDLSEQSFSNDRLKEQGERIYHRQR